MPQLTYRDQRLRIARYAELHVSPAWIYNGTMRRKVQECLDQVEEWDPSEIDVIVETLELDEATFRVPTVSIPFEDGQLEQFFWAVHRSHTAREPGLSPFAKLRTPPVRTNLLTIELAGTPKAPVLVRVYPGEEMMPLPWQGSIRNARSSEDKQDSQKYWRTHAFRAMGNYCRDTATAIMPTWYRTL